MARRKIAPQENPQRFASLQEFLSSSPYALPTGYIEIQHGLPISLYWRNENADVTFVFFAAAIHRGVQELPIFNGMRISQRLKSNILLISDPSLILDTSLLVGWYLGNKHQPMLQKQLSSIIKSFQGDGRVVLYGASGGGFPALYQNLRLKRATTFVANPTTNVTNRTTFDHYLQTAWGVEDSNGLPDTLVLDLRDVYSIPRGNRIIYLQNSFDEEFVKNQFWPFVKTSYSENPIFYLTRFLGEGHVAPDWLSTLRILELLESENDWQALKNKFSALPIESKRSPQSQIVYAE